MKVLGISSNYHDASAALVIDGAVAAAAAEERFTLQKHDPNFPALSAAFCLEQAGLKADDLDAIAYHEDPSAKFSRTLASSFARYPFSLPTFLKSMREAITGGFWIKNRISKQLNVHPRKVVFVPHHCGHAAHGFVTSPFEEAAIMTLDAAGEWMCSGFFVGSRAKGRIEPIAVIPFPHSLGLVYSSFTGFLGFKVNDGECSTMALAAFGQPRFADEVRKIIRPASDGTYEVDGSYFDFSRDDSLPITEKFTRAFGLPRPFKQTLPFDCLSDASVAVPADLQHYADVAASLQLVLEETVLRLAKNLRERTGLRHLCLSGGVALNCVAVGKLIDAGIFDEVFVPPDPGDGGGALGAALFHSFSGGDRGARNFQPYLGKSSSETDILEMFPHLHLRRKVSVRVERNFEKVAVLAAESIAAGKIVGWIQDRFEVGPRALGNRSILANPSSLSTARRLSAKVKKRASFRPYACSIADFELDRAFGGQKSAHSPAARWMQTSSLVAPDARSHLRAAMHVDGTTRPHICAESENARLHRLLKEMGKHSGMAAVLNTSFNESGMPMVATGVEAFLMFLRTDMDMLVVGDSLFAKESN